MPDTPRHPVRFTEAAAADLDALHRRDPQTARAALHKILMLERDPYAGRPLVGDLVGFRKLDVGDRHWRIVWRVLKSADGTTTVEVSEIWAVGARKDAAVYEEVRRRLDTLPDTPATRELQGLLERFGLRTTTTPPPEPAPGWLVDRLIHKTGLSEEEAKALPLDQAIAHWEEWMSRPHD
ncbi:type II toxin-antitoxin system RelE/ParE family toxin [Streptomyces roseirectus]|uniref:Type II toxin-antitoxin system RelE/ParE family toxin n=1 Tax=Streptomyces roseirectus TaxID=2768066 RepID=A0A7H0IDU7_9ACTN|nr:type II toxin-antitoxin system RelE/ParE family toxin [Streptomyces roseirectus]QNP70963.1 type II toxin-antitoxin system RelE/ParE family toxin [Streptomyces roseirectus]